MLCSDQHTGLSGPIRGSSCFSSAPTPRLSASAGQGGQIALIIFQPCAINRDLPLNAGCAGLPNTQLPSTAAQTRTSSFRLAPWADCAAGFRGIMGVWIYIKPYEQLWFLLCNFCLCCFLLTFSGGTGVLLPQRSKKLQHYLFIEIALDRDGSVPYGFNLFQCAVPFLIVALEDSECMHELCGWLALIKYEFSDLPPKQEAAIMSSLYNWGQMAINYILKKKKKGKMRSLVF